MVSLATFVSFANFLGPLVLVDQYSVLYLQPTDCRIYCASRAHHLFSDATVLLQHVCDLHALLVTLKDVCLGVFIEVRKTFDNLVLTRGVDLFKMLLHGCLQLGTLKVNFLNPLIFTIDQEL